MLDVHQFLVAVFQAVVLVYKIIVNAHELFHLLGIGVLHMFESHE